MVRPFRKPHRQLYYMVIGILHELDEEVLGSNDFQRRMKYHYFKGHNLYRNRQLCIQTETPIQTNRYYAFNMFIEKLLDMEYGTFRLDEGDTEML